MTSVRFSQCYDGSEKLKHFAQKKKKKDMCIFKKARKIRWFMDNYPF